MSLVVAASAPADVGIMTAAAASAPSFYYCSTYHHHHHRHNAPFASAPSSPGDDARRRAIPCAQANIDDDEVLKIRRMQDASENEDDHADTPDVQLDAAKAPVELPLSPASCILSDSFCCFSDDTMEEADPHHGLHHRPNPSMERQERCRRPQCQGGQPIGVRIDEGRNTYHSPPNHRHPGVPKFPVSFMVQMGLADATTSEESGQDAMEEAKAGVSSWLQATDYAAIKRDNVKTLLTIQQRIQNPASQHHPIISIVDGCVVDNSNDVGRSHHVEEDNDDVCPRGLETVIEKLIRGAKTGDNRASISHQRRVSQLIVQLYRTHRSLRSKPYPQPPYYRDDARARPFPRKQSSAPGAGHGLATSSSSTLEDDIRAMYEMVSQTDRIRALSLADQDARDVGHRGSVSCCDL